MDVGRPSSSTSEARRADHSLSNGPLLRAHVVGARGRAAVAAPEPVVAAAVEAAVAAVDVGRSIVMTVPRIARQMIVTVALCFGTAAAMPASAAEPQRSFTSPEEAASALVDALRTHQETDLRAILGPDADRVINSGDRYADQELHQRFVALYDLKHGIDRTAPGQAELEVGADDWPLPIPLTESNGRWSFDTAAGAQTIVNRRIGRNELAAIRTLLASIDAQHDYFERMKQQTGIGVYATRLVSTPGRRDGLYWPVPSEPNDSPLGPLIAAAQEAGYPGELVDGKPIPYEGYYFRILRAQGPNGDGGIKTYIRSGRMTGGFALVAWPAVYESTGIMTFVAGPDGDVYQRDLGPETAALATKITTFDPDRAWSRIALTEQ